MCIDGLQGISSSRSLMAIIENSRKISFNCSNLTVPKSLNFRFAISPPSKLHIDFCAANLFSFQPISDNQDEKYEQLTKVII